MKLLFLWGAQKACNYHVVIQLYNEWITRQSQPILTPNMSETAGWSVALHALTFDAVLSLEAPLVHKELEKAESGGGRGG